MKNKQGGKMGFNIEPLFFIVRGGSNFEKYSDNYEWTCVVQKIDCSTVKVIGASGKMDITDMRSAIKKMKKDYGIKKVVWDRYKETLKKVVA